MKRVLFVALLTASAHASILSQYQSSVEGSSEQRFEISKNTIQYVKRSNYFDRKLSYELGTYTVSNYPTQIHKEFEEILKGYKAIDAFLKKKNSSFNDLSDKAPHDSFFFVDEYRVTSKSKDYSDLKAMFEKLQNSEMKNFTGVALSSDLKELQHYEKGKLTKKESFNFSFHCKSETPPSICHFKDHGILYVK